LSFSLNMMLEYAIRTDQSVLSLIKMEQPQNASFTIKSKKLNIYVCICVCVYICIYITFWTEMEFIGQKNSKQKYFKKG